MSPRLHPVAWGVASSGAGIGLLATSAWLIATASLQPPVLSLCVAIGLVQAFSLGRGLARYLQRLAAHRMALETLSVQRLRLFDRLEPLVPAWPDERRRPGPGGSSASGQVLTGFLSDAEAVADATATRAMAAVDVAATVALGGGLAWFVTPVAGAVLVAGALATVVLSLAAHRLGRAAAAGEAAARADLAGEVMEAVGSARELVALGREDLVAERLRRAQELGRRHGHRAALAVGLARAMATWAAGATTVAVVVAGLAAHRSGHLSGVMLAVLALVTLAVVDQLMGLPRALVGVAAGAAAAGRLDRLAGVAPPAREPDHDAGTPADPMSAALEHATTSGAGGERVLDGASVAVQPGCRVALVGSSGAGKTTAVHALLHFLECEEGRATLGGVDVRALRRETIARHTAWLPEEAYLFAASVLDNVRIGLPSATDAECAAALHRVGLGPWLADLPEGLATPLGAGGRPVSAGERQRLGMARALLAGDGVLLLDEPTAHLDPQTSGALLAELLASAGERPVLVVSHEPDIGDLVDEVVAIDRGRTTGSGPAGAPAGTRLAAS